MKRRRNVLLKFLYLWGALKAAPKAPLPRRAREITPKAGVSRVFLMLVIPSDLFTLPDRKVKMSLYLLYRFYSIWAYFNLRLTGKHLAIRPVALIRRHSARVAFAEWAL